ncbi:MAG: hypothetical protein AB7N65_28655 [Vicinamibacterales bacterium]
MPGKPRVPIRDPEVPLRVGIDFGGVMVRASHWNRDDETSPQGTSEAERATEGMFDSVRAIAAACAGRVWIVSKAGPRMQARTLAWLRAVDFFARTDVTQDHVRFCLSRIAKDAICRELEITHFVDDRVHVMQILRKTVPHLYLFGERGEERYCPPWATFVSSWAEVSALVIPRVSNGDQ